MIRSDALAQVEAAFNLPATGGAEVFFGTYQVRASSQADFLTGREYTLKVKFLVEQIACVCSGSRVM